VRCSRPNEPRGFLDDEESFPHLAPGRGSGDCRLRVELSQGQAIAMLMIVMVISVLLVERVSTLLRTRLA
jgi:hypothetical protein